MTVTQNPALNDCCGLRPLLERLDVTEPNFYIQITDNASGCTMGESCLLADLKKSVNFP